MTFLRSSILVALALSIGSVDGFQVSAPQQPPASVAAAPPSRRDVLTNALVFVAALTTNQQEAQASARGYHISRKLKAKEAARRENAPHEALPSGVAIQQFNSGRPGFGTFVFGTVNRVEHEFILTEFTL